MADPHLIRGQTWSLDPRDKRLARLSRKGQVVSFFTSFLFGASMDDIGVDEKVPFVLDQVSRMGQNLEEYRAELMKNEVEAIEVTRHAKM